MPLLKNIIIIYNLSNSTCLQLKIETQTNYFVKGRSDAMKPMPILSKRNIFAPTSTLISLTESNIFDQTL